MGNSEIEAIGVICLLFAFISGFSLFVLLLICPAELFKQADWRVFKSDGKRIDWRSVDAGDFIILIIKRVFLLSMLLSILVLFLN
jgi:hypothetical protein